MILAADLPWIPSIEYELKSDVLEWPASNPFRAVEVKERRADRNSSLSGVTAADGVSEVEFWSSLTASAPPEFILRSRVSGGLEFRQRIVVSAEGAELWRRRRLLPAGSRENGGLKIQIKKKKKIQMYVYIRIKKGVYIGIDRYIISNV